MSSGCGVPQQHPDDCPKCGKPAKRIASEETGAIERALRCSACADTYVLIKDRWWSTS